MASQHYDAKKTWQCYVVPYSSRATYDIIIIFIIIMVLFYLFIQYYAVYLKEISIR